MFENLLLSAENRKSRGRGTWLISGILHTGVLLALLLTPLIHYSSLNEFSPLTYLAPVPVLAAPPAPTPPAPARSEVTRRSDNPTPVILLEDPRLASPIPDAPDVDPVWSLPTTVSGSGQGIPGGPLGSPEGISGLVDLGLKTGLPELLPSPARPSAPEPIRMGGSMQQARKVVHVQPVYPDLARRARVEGVVIIEAVIDELGAVERARILRGHPLLNEAALTAVRQWKYSPTLLNGEPVPVMTTITVVFSLQ